MLCENLSLFLLTKYTVLITTRILQDVFVECDAKRDAECD